MMKKGWDGPTNHASYPLHPYINLITHRWYESSATSPLSPLAVLPGVWEKVSQMEGPRPSVFHAPSIWYDAVAVVGD